MQEKILLIWFKEAKQWFSTRQNSYLYPYMHCSWSVHLVRSVTDFSENWDISSWDNPWFPSGLNIFAELEESAKLLEHDMHVAKQRWDSSKKMRQLAVRSRPFKKSRSSFRGHNSSFNKDNNSISKEVSLQHQFIISNKKCTLGGV